MTRTEKTRTLKDLAARLTAPLEAADLSYTARHYVEDGQPCLELAGPPGSPSFELLPHRWRGC
jgi:hypothetical protein